MLLSMSRRSPGDFSETWDRNGISISLDPRTTRAWCSPGAVSFEIDQGRRLCRLAPAAPSARSRTRAWQSRIVRMQLCRFRPIVTCQVNFSEPIDLSSSLRNHAESNPRAQPKPQLQSSGQSSGPSKVSRSSATVRQTKLQNIQRRVQAIPGSSNDPRRGR